MFLFKYLLLDWTYTLEGAKVIRIRLNAEQYESATLDPDRFAEYHTETTYTEEMNEDGNLVIVRDDYQTQNLPNVIRGTIVLNLL